MNKTTVAVSRIFALILFAAMMLSFAACGDDSNQTNKPGSFTAYTGPFSDVNGALTRFTTQRCTGPCYQHSLLGATNHT